MLEGKKPMAMFFDVLPECGVIPRGEFRPYVESGQILMREAVYHPVHQGKKDAPLRYIYYATPKEGWRIEAMHRIQREIASGLRPATDEDDIAIGRLLGYSEKDILRFLARQAKRLASI